MSERKYCARCGEQVRSADAFCISCGASLSSRYEGAGPTDQGPTRAERRSLFHGLLIWLRWGAGRLEGISSGPSTSIIRRLLGRAVRWFWDLPGILRVLGGVTLALFLLVPLSRVTLVASALAFGLSAVVLTVRVARRGPVGKWGIVAAASLVMVLASYGTYNALQDQGDAGRSNTGTEEGNGQGNRTPNNAGSFEDPADTRLCLGSDGPADYSGPALDFRVVDSKESKTASGARVLAMVAGTSLYGDLDAIGQNLAVNPDEYDAVEVTIFPREWAFYTPSQGVQPLPGGTDFSYNTYYVAHSPAGETIIGLPDENLNECGSSYKEGGYKWGMHGVY